MLDPLLPNLQLLDLPRSAWCGLCLSAVVSSIALYYRCGSRRYQREAERLNLAVRQLLRGGSTPIGLSFVAPALSDIWRMTLSALISRRQESSAEDAYREVISLTSSIAATIDGSGTTAEKLLALMLRQGTPELVAGAVLRFDSESSSGKIDAIVGVVDRRLQRFLIQTVEEIRTANQEPAWGYTIPERGSRWDFSTFGVGMSYLAPLGEGGLLWLGLGVSSQSLSARKQWLIQCLAEHGTASLEASGRIQLSRERELRERDFLLGVSHDLRAPGHSALYALRSIAGEIATIHQDQLRMAEGAILEQLRLVSDFLDISRHEKGYLEARKERCCLTELVPSLLSLHQETLSKSDISIETVVPPGLAIFFDPQHLRRTLTNYLSNAIKFTERGSITIRCEQINDRVEISVEDSGPGIPEADRTLLFRRFQKLSGASRSVGFGLGLSLVKALAEINDGYVFYRTSASGGSIFGIGAPMFDADPANPQLPKGLGRVLLVDDDPSILRTTSRYLRDSALSIVLASTVEEALERIAEATPDLIISDYRLGESDAGQLFKRLDEINNATPALLFSGFTGGHPPFQQTRRHVQHLAKPAGREELISAARAAQQLG